MTDAIRLGTTTDETAGNVRWTGTDFEGYNGTTWDSLTSGGGLVAHDIDGIYHTVTGSQYQVVGLTATDTLGLLTPASDPAGANVVLLRTDTNGNIKLQSGLTFNAAATIATVAGALTLQPVAGSGVNVNLSTTGDFIVNTSHLAVDSSTGRTGLGTPTPGALLDVYAANGVARISGTGGVNRGLVSTLEFYNYGASQIVGQIKGLRGLNDVNAGQLAFYTSDDAGTLNEHITITKNGLVGIGETAPGGRLTVDQSSTTAAIPTLELEQADLSEEFINFVTTIGAGNPVQVAALGALYGKLRVAVNGTFKYLALYDS
jgi:hypothetical protein